MSSRFLSIKIFFVILLCGSLLSCSVAAGGNQVGESVNVIEGYDGNRITDEVNAATISGGGWIAFPNHVSGDFGAVAGGRGNTAGNFSTVGGGESNTAEGIRATIGGGAENSASRNNAVVAGGYGNTASQSNATIGGGKVNVADGSYATISGGVGNLATGRISTIGGGTRNQTQSAYSTVGGGSFNLAIGGTSTIGGGTSNHTPGIGSTIAGGAGNTTMGLQSTIAGGLSNIVSDNYSVVTGGRQNHAGNGNDDWEDTPYASVGGGYENRAGGAYSVVPGGYGNLALGDYSFAAGNEAQVNAGHAGVFLFADSNNSVFASSAPNEFAVRATGGVRFVTALDTNGEPLVGVRLASGSGSWETLSDRNAKTSILPVNSLQVMNALMTVPISTWRYKGQSTPVQHIGPMAQDFYAAFGMGEDAHYIGSVDADGVALAAIQGLYQIVQEKDIRISALEKQNADQQQHLDNLENRLAKLEKQVDRPTSQVNWFTLATLIIGLVLGRYWLAPHRTA